MAEAKPPDRQNERFPRSTNLPSQSPLFWVEQKDRYLRQLLIRDVEDLTGRRLAVDYANRFEDAQIDGRETADMAELLQPLDGGRWSSPLHLDSSYLCGDPYIDSHHRIDPLDLRCHGRLRSTPRNPDTDPALIPVGCGGRGRGASAGHLLSVVR